MGNTQRVRTLYAAVLIFDLLIAKSKGELLKGLKVKERLLKWTSLNTSSLNFEKNQKMYLLNVNQIKNALEKYFCFFFFFAFFVSGW